MKPRIGMRVRFVKMDHPDVRPGTLGTIDVVHENGSDFWVATECGGFYGWTSFRSWHPTKEPADE